jgi:hypothetical protein
MKAFDLRRRCDEAAALAEGEASLGSGLASDSVSSYYPPICYKHDYNMQECVEQAFHQRSSTLSTNAPAPRRLERRLRATLAG